MVLQFPWVMEIDPIKNKHVIRSKQHRIRFLHNGKLSDDINEFNHLTSGEVTITELTITDNGVFNLPFNIKCTSAIPYIHGLRFAGYMFSDCKNLKYINGDLFKFNPQILKFNKCFSNCTQLKLIPNDLFKYNVEAIAFHNCFDNCVQLTTIPGDLFKYNTNAISFSECFYNCRQIKNIPEGLFSNTTIKHDIDIQGCFEKCKGIKKLEHQIFPNNFRATKESVDLMFGVPNIKLSKIVQLSML